MYGIIPHINTGRVAWLINALASNNIDQLKYGVEDALHQPQRGAAVYPHLYPIIRAAENAGGWVVIYLCII